MSKTIKRKRKHIPKSLESEEFRIIIQDAGAEDYDKCCDFEGVQEVPCIRKVHYEGWVWGITKKGKLRFCCGKTFFDDWEEDFKNNHFKPLRSSVDNSKNKLQKLIDDYRKGKA